MSTLSVIKRVVVTGGNKGIGKALCKRILTEYENTFVYLGSRDATRGQAAVDDILKEMGATYERRIEVLLVDVSQSGSVENAAAAVKEKLSEGDGLFGIVNNAGIGFGRSALDCVNTNTLGAKRMFDSFLPLLQSEGRIVNISSASGPMYVAKLPPHEQTFFTGKGSLATHTAVTWEELESEMSSVTSNPEMNDMSSSYGFSKACLNVLTMQQADNHLAKDKYITVNACTPGFIDTDLTKGMGASGTTYDGCKSALQCLFGIDGRTGMYFGSDGVRSPLHLYRGPGDPEYLP